MELNHFIEQGLSLLSWDTKHNLELEFRIRILCALDESDEVATRLGQSRRIKLAVLVVQKVLPLWNLQFPKLQIPHQALKLLKELINGEKTVVEAEKQAAKLWSLCEEAMYRYQSDQAMMMLSFGAVQAVREATSYDSFNRRSIVGGVTDQKIDPYDFDASFCAACAYSQGAPWESNSNSAKRLEFWQWWLTSAIVEAIEPGISLV
jgi:hypothetical protein